MINNLQIIKQNRKTISIKVNFDETVTVKCPKILTEKTVLDFINKKEQWILKNLTQIRAKKQKYDLVISKKQSLTLNRLVPFIKKSNFEREASVYLSQKTQELSQILGLNYSSLSFKNYKSRWGCCNSKKEIILNYKLYMLDENTIKYVIIHELLHTIYLNHGKDFKNNLKRLVGNVNLYKNRLKEVGFLLNI